MTLLDLNTRVANVLAAAETELRAVALEAARQIATKAGVTGPVALDLDHGLVAAIDGFKGDITIAGLHVGNVPHLLEIIHAAEKHLDAPDDNLANIFSHVEDAVVAPAVAEAHE